LLRKQQEGYAMKVGDKVKVLEQCMMCLFPVGTVGEVTEIIESHGNRAIRVDANKDYWHYAECELEVVL
jgi:hypothetical protein